VLDKTLIGLGKWAAREEWASCFSDIFELHVAEICDRADMDFDEVAEVVGEDDARLVWQCAFEDFLARPFEPDGRNVVDDYLKRRGWKESATHKRRIEALQKAVMSLYLVEKVVPGQSLAVRDLIRGGEVISVSDAAATRELEIGDRIGARVLVLPDRNVLSAGWLAFGKEVADGFATRLKPGMKRVRSEFRKVIREKDIDLGGRSSNDASDFVFLLQAAPAFSLLWLSHRIAEELQESIPAILAEVGDDVALCRLYFPFRPETSPAALRERLDRYDEFRADGVDLWNWVDTAHDSSAQEEDLHDLFQLRLDDGTPVLGNLELFAKELKLTTMSRNAAEQGRTIIRDLAGDLLEQPTTTIETLDDPDIENAPLQGTLDLRLPAKSGRASRQARQRRVASSRRS